jgi:quercetin dioxygenase-like cupin family protein
MPNQNEAKYVPAGTGPMYWGPDRVTFLLTGAESRGHCFIIEQLIPPGGGPPPHVHEFEDETFFILEGGATFTAGDRTIKAAVGDFIHIPRGVVHSIKNEGKVNGRALVIITPAGPTGMQKFFEESFTPVTDRKADPPLITEELMKRMMASAAKNGLQIIPPGPR